MFGESITRTRPTVGVGEDAQGNPNPGTPSTATISLVAPAPGRLEEQADVFGPKSDNWWTLYCRSTTPMDLLSDDLVTFRGESGWQVVGDAKVIVWTSPYSHATRGSVAEIRRAT